MKARAYVTDPHALARLPALTASVSALRALFAAAGPPASLPNPHLEPQVSPGARLRARRASVLVLVCQVQDPVILLTRRSARLRYPGHEVFPGGLRDPADGSALATMYREVHEEIGLAATDFEVLGQLGDYCTHTGYRITPFVGYVPQRPALTPSPHEVAGISYLPLCQVLDASNYKLRVRATSPFRANYFLRHGKAQVTGPTVSLLMHLYAALASLHAAAVAAGPDTAGPLDADARNGAPRSAKFARTA